MHLDARQVLEVLRGKGITKLVHSDTVRTSCSFLRSGKMLSRGTLDDLRLPKTEQRTDDIDRRHGLWYDVFVDTVDIHRRARKRNYYGPVLFDLSLEVLDQSWLSSIWITKSNPANWNPAMELVDMYYQSVQNFDANFTYGNFDKLFILRNVGDSIRLQDFLQRIVLDDPVRSLDEVSAFNVAYNALEAATVASGLGQIEIVKRTCIDCQCVVQYQNMSYPVFEKFFHP